MKLGLASKAIVAFITGGAGALIAGLSDGQLTTTEIITAVVTGVVAAGAVFSVTNAAVSVPAPSDDSVDVDPPQAA